MMLSLFKKKKADPHAELCKILGDFELPSFPAVITAALEKVRDDDAPVSAIADLVSADPGVSVRLMGTVNSAAFALRHEVKSIHHAVSLLGRNQLESMLISMAVGGALPSEASRGFEAKRFWTTSARRATTCRALAELIDPAARSESFTAALLQDLAVPILSHHKGGAYGEILEHWHGGGEDLAEIEQGAFGWNHAGVGEALCRAWDFPEKLSAAIGLHHGGAEDDVGPLPAVRLVAGLREVDEERGIERVVETTHAKYGIPHDQTVELIRSGYESAAEIARMFT